MPSREPENHPPLPIPHCYWVIPGKLLAGDYPRTPDEASSREKLKQLTDAGVSAFIDLTDPATPATTDGHLKPYAHLLDGPSHQRFAIRDLSVPASPELTKQALDAIDALLAAGKTVYVHCGAELDAPVPSSGVARPTLRARPGRAGPPGGTLERQPEISFATITRNGAAAALRPRMDRITQPTAAKRRGE